MYRWGVFICAVALTGTAQGQSAPHGYKITNDRFEPSVTVVSPDALVSSPSGGRETYALRSFVKKSDKSASHQIYVRVTYTGFGWRYYNQAFDENAHSHTFVVIDRQVDTCGLLNGCMYTETFGADLADAEIVQGSKLGMSLKFKSQSGFDEVITFEPSFFMGQLNALNAFVDNRYQVDRNKLAAADPGLTLYNMGGINNRLYNGVDHGLKVSGVTPGSPAAIAGVGKGDMLLDMGEIPLKRMDDYRAALGGFHAGQTVPIKVKRAGQIVILNLAL